MKGDFNSLLACGDLSSADNLCKQFALQTNFVMEANTMNQDWTAHKGAVWVDIVCNIGNQSTSANEKADNICCEWLGNGLKIMCHYNCFFCLFFVVVFLGGGGGGGGGGGQVFHHKKNIMSIQYMKEHDAEFFTDFCILNSKTSKIDRIRHDGGFLKS